MRDLIVKTSSLADLIHTFPAITDAAAALPGVEFHWLVEEAFVQVPQWHPAVSRVIPIALRRWRGNWRAAWKKGQIRHFLQRLREDEYDRIIDAQGLLKSALPARLARGPVTGYDRRSAREPLASLFYGHRLAVSRQNHAIERIRALFAQAFDYVLPDSTPDYGLRKLQDEREQALVFLHSTTWSSKHWPLPWWQALSGLADQAGYRVLFPWYAPEERLRAEKIIARSGVGELLPRMELNELKQHLETVAGVVGVDTGLAHLAAALDVPAVTLYGPTQAGLTGAVGEHQQNLTVDFPCAPCLQRECGYKGQSPVWPACFQTLPPAQVWMALQQQMALA